MLLVASHQFSMQHVGSLERYFLVLFGGEILSGTSVVDRRAGALSKLHTAVRRFAVVSWPGLACTQLTPGKRKGKGRVALGVVASRDDPTSCVV